VLEVSNIARVFEEADRFDRIHNHFELPPLMWSQI
jgi:hypothetical protein